MFCQRADLGMVDDPPPWPESGSPWPSRHRDSSDNPAGRTKSARATILPAFTQLRRA
ncbi:hypothetical protein KCP73_18810 [Salmonella enterica subsp. enterica]|nr:hypothetical protein KCP73_18810 [Salmonella enterica subsp. enterica]